MKKLNLIFLALFVMFGCKKGDNDGCNDKPDSDAKQRVAQEQILQEANAQVGMPAIANFRERKIMKDILELRDQTGLSTYTYLVAEMSGKLVFLCASVGYGLPVATQFTNPEKPVYGEHGNFTLPNADPNGLFSPSSAEGTWVMCLPPGETDVKVVYIEPRVVVSPFPLIAEPNEKPEKE